MQLISNFDMVHCCRWTPEASIMQRIRLNAALITLESDLRHHRAIGHQTQEFINGYLPDFKQSPAELPNKPEGRVAVFRDVTALERTAVTKTLLAEMPDELESLIG